MALVSRQLLTEMSTRNFRRGKLRPECRAENPTAICEPTVQRMWKPRRLTTLWASTACYRDSLAREADITAIYEPIIYKNVGASTSHNPTGLHGLLTGTASPFMIIRDSLWRQNLQLRASTFKQSLLHLNKRSVQSGFDKTDLAFQGN
jgi:hypothetical protein